MGETTDHRHMSPTEAMMWNLESDPWLAPSGGSVVVYDQPLDDERFRRAIAASVAEVPRLRQRVLPGAGGVAAPRWVADREFDLDWHVRRIGAPGNGTLRELLDWTTPYFQDAYDRSRPLWQFVIVDGLEGGRGALVAKLHHTISDGEGAIVMAMKYTALQRDVPAPDPVDLDAIVAAEPVEDEGPVGVALDAVGQTVRASARAGRDMLERMASPQGWRRARDETADLMKSAADTRQSAGSELWSKRSRRRHMEVIDLPFDEVRAAAKALGGTINDFFVTGLVEGTRRYHERAGVPLDRVHTSFVVSTRTDESAENAFTPVPVDIPLTDQSLAERFTSIGALLLDKREQVHGEGPIALVAGLVNLIPASVASSVARSQAAHLDFATSNLQGFLGDTYVAGAKTLHSYPFGPLAGTAMNATQVSMNEFLDIGLHIDPVAVAEPAVLRSLIDDAYRDLLDAA